MVFRAILSALCLCLAASASAQVSPESAEKYNAGQELFKKHRYQEALKAFEEAVQLDGKNAQAYQAIGLAYQKLRQWKKAAESHQMAATVKPDYTAAYYALGEVRFQRLKKYGAAQASFKKVLGLDPGFQDGKARRYLKAAYIKQGLLDFRQRNYKKAAAQYENAAQVDPSDATIFFNLGLAYRRGRNYTKARQAFQTAIDLDPKYAKAHRSLGDLYKVTKKNSLAARAYRQAIQADPKGMAAYLSLASVYNGLKQQSRAVAILRKAAAVAPGNSKIHEALGYSYMQQKSYTNAVASYRKALQLRSDNPAAYYRIGNAYFYLKNYPRAVANASKALGSKYSIAADVLLGDVYEAWRPDGWKEKAISHYTKGLKDRRNQKYCEDKIDRINNPMGPEEEEETSAR